MSGVWSKLASAFKRAAPGSTIKVNDGLFIPQWATPPKRGTKELIQAHRTQPWLRAVTNRISGGVSAVPWRLYAKSAKADKTAKEWRFGEDVATLDKALTTGNRESRQRRMKELRQRGQLREIPDHPILDMLERPNPYMTGQAATALVQTYLDVPGEVFLGLQRGPGGLPIGYFPLPPHWILELPSVGKPYYRLAIGTVQGDVPESEIIPLRHLDPSNPFGRGSGVGEALGDELETDEYASKTVKAWFYNKAIPEILVAVRGASTPAQLAQQRELWDQLHKGPGNSARANFIGGEVSVTRLDTAWKDAQYIELRKNQRDFVRQVFAVPPEVMGVIENSNRATIQAAFFLFAQGVLVPRLEFLRTELQQRLVPLFDDRIVLDYESPVPEDKEFTLNVAKALPAAFSLNEIRELAGHEPLPEFEGVFPPLAQPGQSSASGADKGEGKPGEDPEAEEGEPADKPKKKPPAPDAEKTLGDPPWASAGLP